MKGNIPLAEATRDEAVLPEHVQQALGQLVGAAKEGLLALSVGVGLGVLTELMEAEVDDVCGAEGQAQRRPERGSARSRRRIGDARWSSRGGSTTGVRTADGEAEILLQTYEHVADRDPLRRIVLERMPTTAHAEHTQATCADVLAAAFAATPERFVRRPPRPPALPTAAWINKRDSEEAQA